MAINWQHLQINPTNGYTCGYCGKVVASNVGWHSSTGQSLIYICPYCNQPSFLTSATQIPGVAPGAEIEHLPEDVNALYREARNCVAISSYTAAVLSCRKLLMNIAVSQKAEEGKPFIFYVQYLADQGFVPPHGKGWVDHIRTKGNEANHEIALMTKADADDLITFCEMLLKFIYEFPSKVPRPKKT
jgi:hypothetical protein